MSDPDLVRGSPKSISSGSGWWVHVEPWEPAKDEPGWFERVAVFMLLDVHDNDEAEPIPAVVALTAAELSDGAGHVVDNSLEFRLHKDQFGRELFHDGDFEILGEKLKPSKTPIGFKP
jgi:hypothetical protein